MPVARLGRIKPRYRRSRALLLYWADGRLAYFDCRTGQRRTSTIDVMSLLDQMHDWVTAAELRGQHQELGREADVESLLREMVKLGVAERETRQPPWKWAEWMPEAAFFHFGTRDGHYPVDFFKHEARLREKAKTNPQPASAKSMTGPRTDLLPPGATGALGAALESRRTWRNFGDAPVSFESISTLLALTWGVRGRGRVEGQGDIVFKTSPSGGSRHPIEVYVIAKHVDGLARGVYHYDCSANALVAVGPAIADDRLTRILAHQYYFAPSAALFVMTACFERTMWRYPIRRAYRAVLAEAGHLGQTFCLVATHLGLAPFCTMAFHDTRLERLLGVRNDTEAAVYLVGVGSRPTKPVDHPGRIPPRRAE